MSKMSTYYLFILIIMLKKLQQLGLSEKEAVIYMTGLGSGPITLLEISKQSKIKRSTVYDIMPELLSQGYFSKSIIGKKIHYVANHPNVLKVAQRDRDSMLSSLFPELEALFVSEKRHTSIFFYDNIEDIRSAHIKNIKIQKGELLAIEDYKLINILTSSWIEKYITERKKNNIFARSIATNTPDGWTGKDIEDKRKTKILPKNSDFEISLTIYDNSVLITSLKGEFVCVEVQGKIITTAMRSMFQIMWSGLF